MRGNWKTSIAQNLCFEQSCVNDRLEGQKTNRVQRDAKYRKTHTSNSGFGTMVIAVHLYHRSCRHSLQICKVRLADASADSMFGFSRRAAAIGYLTVLRRWSGICSLQSWHLNIGGCNTTNCYVTTGLHTCWNWTPTHTGKHAQMRREFNRHWTVTRRTKLYQ